MATAKPPRKYLYCTEIKHDGRGTCRADLEDEPGLDNADSDLRQADFLSQRLSGFNDWLLKRSGAAMPDNLIDTDYAPDPMRTSAQSRFRVVRAGQITFVDLRIIDRFGRTSTIVSPYQRGPLHFFPEPATDLVPNLPLYPGATDLHRFMQLSPRILCDARVEFVTRNTTGSHDGIVGWLLANKLDHSVAVYMPSGQPLGALRATFENLIDFVPLPHAPYQYTDADFGVRFPDLRAFLVPLIRSSSTRLTRLLELFEQAEQHMVDSAETDDDAPANFIGRPYALVTALAALKLRQPSPRDPSWETILDQPEPDLTRNPHTYRAWLGRVGDELSDGLVGYFTSVSSTNNTVNYTRMYAAAFPQIPTVDYIQAPSIDTVTRLSATTGNTARHLTLLVHPHLVARAHTGVLPSAELTLNPHAVSYALHHLQAAFLTTPLLTTMAVMTDDTDDIAIVSTHPGTDNDPLGHLIDGNPGTSYVSRDLITTPAIISLTPRIPTTFHNVTIAWDTRFATSGIRITVRHIDIAGVATVLVSDYTPGPEPRSILGSRELNPLRELTLTISGQGSHVALTGVKLLTEALAARNHLLTYPPDARQGSYEWSAPYESTGEYPHWTRQPLAPTDITPHIDPLALTAYSGYLLLTPPFSRETGELIATSAQIYRNADPDIIQYRYQGFGTPGALVQVLHTDNQWRTPEEPTSQTLVKPDGSFDTSISAYGSGTAIAQIRQTVAGAPSIPVSIHYELQTELRLLEVQRRSEANQLYSYSYAGMGTRGADIEIFTAAGSWQVLGRIDAGGEFSITEMSIPAHDRDIEQARLRQRINAVASSSVTMPYTKDDRLIVTSALVHNQSNTRRFHYSGFGTPCAIIEVFHSDNQWITPDAPESSTIVNENGSFEVRESPYGASVRPDARLRQIVDGVASDPVIRLYELETPLQLIDAERERLADGAQQRYTYRGRGTRGASIEVLTSTGAWRSVGAIDSSGSFSLTQNNVPTADRDLNTATIRQRINTIIESPVSRPYTVPGQLSVLLAATYTEFDNVLFDYHFRGVPDTAIQIDHYAVIIALLDSTGEAIVTRSPRGNLTTSVNFKQVIDDEWITVDYTLRDPLVLSKAARSYDGTSFEYAGSGTPGAQLSVQTSQNTFQSVGVIGSTGQFSFQSPVGSRDAIVIARQSIRDIRGPNVEYPYSELPSPNPFEILSANMFMQLGMVRFSYHGTGIPGAHIEIRLDNGQWSSLIQGGSPTVVDQNRGFRVTNTDVHATGGIAEMRQVLNGTPIGSTRRQYTTQGISILLAQTAPGRSPDTLIYTQFGFTPGLEVELKGRNGWRKMSFQGTNWGVGDFESTPSEFDPATATIRGVVGDGGYTPELTVQRINRSSHAAPFPITGRSR